MSLFVCTLSQIHLNYVNLRIMQGILNKVREKAGKLERSM